jgi:hypothetical protein
MRYLVGLTGFAGLVLPILLALVLYALLHVLLTANLVGTARMMRAMLGSFVLALLLFPWQSILNSPAITNDPASIATGIKIPGVLYTWAELSQPAIGAHFSTAGDLPHTVLHWARFVVWPVVAICILLGVQAKSSRALREALGWFGAGRFAINNPARRALK